jgi:hypothetical protein
MAECKNKQAGNRFIQSMYRIQVMSDLISGHLQQIALVATTERAAMNGYTRRLKYGNKILVLINNLYFVQSLKPMKG